MCTVSSHEVSRFQHTIAYYMGYGKNTNFLSFYFIFIFISWRLITLQYGTLIFELVLARDWQTFSEKAQVVNILGFALHTITVTLTQLCHCCAKAAIDYANNVGVALSQ